MRGAMLPWYMLWLSQVKVPGSLIFWHRHRRAEITISWPQRQPHRHAR